MHDWSYFQKLLKDISLFILKLPRLIIFITSFTPSCSFEIVLLIRQDRILNYAILLMRAQYLLLALLFLKPYLLQIEILKIELCLIVIYLLLFHVTVINFIQIINIIQNILNRKICNLSSCNYLSTSRLPNCSQFMADCRLIFSHTAKIIEFSVYYSAEEIQTGWTVGS